MTKEEFVRNGSWILKVIHDRCELTQAETDYLNYLIEVLEQEPCEDCISRADLISLLIPKIKTRKSTIEIKDKLIPLIKSLNPIQLKSKTEWIPVSERLPKAFEYVNCTCHSLIDDREDWVVETCYIPQPQNSPYSDWGNIPMLNHGECEVVAWMYREIPEPYKAESEDK